MYSPFDFLNSINNTKEDLIGDSEANEKDYIPFLVNRGLSYFPDTILMANLMNQYGHLDKKLQYSYYLNGIKKRNRYAKWGKTETPENLEVIKKYYNYSDSKAIEALKCLSEAQIDEIKKIVESVEDNIPKK